MNKEIRQIIDYIRWNFSIIKGDWTDPRWNCREGLEAVDRLLELLGEKPEKPYRHFEDISLEEWLKEIKKRQESIKKIKGLYLDI